MAKGLAQLWVGILVGLTLCSLAVFDEMNFRQNILALPAETAIRPMGMAVTAIGLALAGVLFGLPFSVLGLLKVYARGKPSLLLLGIIGIVFCYCLCLSVSICSTRRFG